MVVHNSSEFLFSYGTCIIKQILKIYARQSTCVFGFMSTVQSFQAAIAPVICSNLQNQRNGRNFYSLAFQQNDTIKNAINTSSLSEC